MIAVGDGREKYVYLVASKETVVVFNESFTFL